METLDIVLIAVEAVLSLLLFIPVKLSKKLISTKWRICYVIPFIICMVIAGITGFEKLMLPAYIGSCITLIGYFRDSEKVRIVSLIVCAVMCVCSAPLCVGNPDYRARDFALEFKEIFSVLKKHYVLAEHKGIDWDDLYSRYYPMFEEASKEHSSVKNYLAWNRFTCEFRDGHVYYMDNGIKNDESYDEVMTEIFDSLGAGDFGLSLMGLSDGRTAAVNVDSESAASKAGIHNGTIITSWNGQAIEEAGRTSPLTGVTTKFADKDNEAFFLALQASVNGGDSVTVTFIDDEGAEKTAELPRIDSGYSRYQKTMETVCRGVEDANFGWVEINEDTICLRLKAMYFDAKSSNSGKFIEMKSELKIALNRYKAEGKKNLVIDMRNNGGGSGTLVKTLGEIFAPKGTYFYAADGRWDDNTHSYARDPETGKFLKGDEHYFEGEDIWEGNSIIILVNSESASAADHFTKIMRGMENVTVMGFTEPNGSAQGIGTAGSGKGALCFSNCLMLDKEGEIFIDSGADQESGNDIDIRVPFDEEAVRVLFDEDSDYLMQKAVEYFNE